MSKLFRCSWIVAAVAFPLAAAPNITNIVINSTIPGTATVTWSTDVPATSEVDLTDDSSETTHRYPYDSGPDTTLVTNHSVTLTFDPYFEAPNGGGFFYCSVLSSDASGSLARVDGQRVPLLAANPGAAFDYKLYANGPANVYAGDDLIFAFGSMNLGGSAAFLYIDPTSVSFSPAAPGVSFHMYCGAFSASVTPTQIDWLNPDGSRGFCSSNELDLARFRTSSTTPPGTYTATITTISNGTSSYGQTGGVQHTFTYTFTVRPQPNPTVAPALSYPAIPGLSAWQTKMTSLGALWCHSMDNTAAGNQQDVWYYDGTRVYFQIADYTSNAAWLTCAASVNNAYRTWALANNGRLGAYELFPAGLAMDYWRNGSVDSKTAVLEFSNFWGAGFVLLTTTYPGGSIRELSYIIESMIKAQQLGQPNPWLPTAINEALGMVDEQFKSRPFGSGANQVFMDGLMAQALIHYYEMTPDPRIPPAIAVMLNWLMDPANGAYDPVTHGFAYNVMQNPKANSSALNNLVVPAFAWMWKLTGDSKYLNWGDDLFQHSVDDDISYSGKIFSQNYSWSFDYVRYRSGLPLSATDPSNNSSGGSSVTAPPTITGFTANPSVITAGQSTILSWSANGATSVSIDNGGGSGLPAGSGSISVSPAATTTYTLTASNSGGSISARVSVTVNAAVSGSKATLVSPSPGSTLPGSTVTFSWTQGSGVTNYWLDVGNSQGVGDISAGALTATSETVSNLPVDGRTLYIRLWSFINGSWTGNYNDYTVKAAILGAKATLISPAPGSTLGGSTVTFSWTQGSGATNYWLDVGNSQGVGDISAGALTSTSKTVSNLPVDGRTLYIRLWSYIGGSWSGNYNDYTVTAASGAAKATLISPVPGSALPGATVTFSWTAGIGVTNYWLDVGNSQGVGDISAGALTSTSKTVSNLPVDGRTLYIRLWSFINGSWTGNYNDYIVTAH